MKVRQNLYIDRELSDALDSLARRPGGNKSRMVNTALSEWLARRGTKEIDNLFKARLDRISRDIANCRRDIEVVLECLALFVRYQLTVTAPIPEGDATALAIGKDRFERFIAQLGRQLASGKSSIPSGEQAG
jgi:predicted transcriptional regulator